MADLVGGQGNGRASNGGARAQGPVPVSQTGQQSKLTTPTDIMRRRREREEAKLQAEAATAATAALAQTRPLSGWIPIPAAGRSQERTAESITPAEASTHRRTSSYAQGQTRLSDPGPQAAATRPPVPTGDLPPVPRPRPTAQSQGQPRPVQSGLATPAAAPRRPQVQQPAQTSPEAQRVRPTVQSATSAAQGTVAPTAASTFPHAFERWETLSSHWEGLTSYWIRKLQQNTKELEREPTLQQLSRQVTDLSAAGANLFHAVVELQRLRASSERKFQRWFHETRKDAERQQEVTAQYERALLGERGARSNDVGIMQAELDAAHAAIARLEKQNSEMQREQQISKDEARRAWEELGRREQEAREQVAALREGQPILIGGMQVFPTAHATSLLHHDMPTEQDVYGHTDTRGSPTNTDPFTEVQATEGYPSATNGTRVPSSSLHSGAQGESGFYQHPASYLHSGSDLHATPEAQSGGHNAFVTDDIDEYEQEGHPLSRYNSHVQPVAQQAVETVSASTPSYPAADERVANKYGPAASTAVSYPAVPAPTSGRIEPITAAASAPLTAYGGAAGSAPPTTSASFAHSSPVDYEGTGYEDYDVNQLNSRLSVVDELDEEASRASVVSTQNVQAPPF